MNRKTFNQYIAESDFRTLFIREMMWNNPTGQTRFDISVEDTTYRFEQIAQRNGFQVLTCVVGTIPTSSQAKKIDTQLRKQANDYICIYCLPDSQHHLWAVPVNKVEKRDIVLVEYSNAENASFLYEKMDGLSFEIDDVTTIMDVKECVQAAFIVNSEKLTKDFYAGFKKEHSRFAELITGIDDEITDIKKNKNKQWYTSVMLNRLMFCYFIQKKGFLDMDENYLRKKLETVQHEQGENQFYGSFYKGFLCSLFHDGLNSPRHQQNFLQKYGRIPYLNGGMFDEHELEKQYPDIDIDDRAFENLFDFFDKWRWHLDDRITATGRDINPDVLGYIFEQYINDRAQMGAYYTKEDITEYIGRNTIVPFLLDKTKETTPGSFGSKGDVWKFLQQSGDRYIYDAVKHGHETPVPEHIAVGIDTTKPNLLERRSRWNERTPEPWALPTEIWRETVERLQRYESIRQKIEGGEIKEVNDFITYNLNIRNFAYDYLQNTEDHLFVKHFYSALQHVSILDPTCGSGAFLFAALNILEPLYEICITRMQEWNAKNPKLFEKELQELNSKYRSNIRYFIYKSIILRNLYGVDIMVEATEIAKLRLFLKMVAVVDVNPFDENLGLDPLPDIDFNIRCGNTLVGYATAQDLENDLTYGDMFANKEFKEKVTAEMDVVSSAYDTFRKVQLEQDSDLETFKKAKSQLKDRLSQLNELLNRKLHTATAISADYDEWKRTHQPFHWLAEYYDIIKGNGGFDVIIGNPPYVVYTKKDKESGKSIADIYRVVNYQTVECNNLYAFTIERSLQLLSKKQRVGMIVPLSFTAAKNMQTLRNIMVTERYICVSSYEIRPGKLFDGNKGADQRLNIFISAKANNNTLITSKVLRWASEHRKWLFNNLHFYSSINEERIWRFSSPIEFSIYSKYSSDSVIGQYVTSFNDDPLIHYRSAGLRYWIIFLCKGFNTESASNKEKHICNKKTAEYLMAALNSNLFWWYYSINYDMFNLTDSNIFDFRLNYDKVNDVGAYAEELENDLDNNKLVSIVTKSNGEINQSFAYQKKLSKPIIDEIDKVLAKHYGFTEEELDFIINYDIKYRMGDELGEEGGAEVEVKKEAPVKEKQQQAKSEKKSEPIPQDTTLTLFVRHETLERIASGEKTTYKRYLDDDDFNKKVLESENGEIKVSGGHCPYTAKRIDSVKLVCDKESLVKIVKDITFRSGLNQQGKPAWKIIFHF
ncbi:MAG: Eco57I restriction-modification methylase domain-containing protein [Prevotella sp.]|nr:Eco57I restriction-modification methylase domain-containing protein [Prevotella sp.]